MRGVRWILTTLMCSYIVFFSKIIHFLHLALATLSWKLIFHLNYTAKRNLIKPNDRAHGYLKHQTVAQAWHYHYTEKRLQWITVSVNWQVLLQSCHLTGTGRQWQSHTINKVFPALSQAVGTEALNCRWQVTTSPPIPSVHDLRNSSWVTRDRPSVSVDICKDNTESLHASVCIICIALWKNDAFFFLPRRCLKPRRRDKWLHPDKPALLL